MHGCPSQGKMYMAGSIFFGKTTSYVAGLGKAYGITQYNLNINEASAFHCG